MIEDRKVGLNRGWKITGLAGSGSASVLNLVLTASHRETFVTYLLELQAKKLPERLELIFENLQTLTPFIQALCEQNKLEINARGELGLRYEVFRAGEKVEKVLLVETTKLELHEISNLFGKVENLKDLYQRQNKTVTALKSQVEGQAKMIQNLESRLNIFVYPESTKKHSLALTESEIEASGYKLREPYLSRTNKTQRNHMSYRLFGES